MHHSEGLCKKIKKNYHGEQEGTSKFAQRLFKLQLCDDYVLSKPKYSSLSFH